MPKVFVMFATADLLNCVIKLCNDQIFNENVDR